MTQTMQAGDKVRLIANPVRVGILENKRICAYTLQSAQAMPVARNYQLRFLGSKAISRRTVIASDDSVWI